VQWAALIAWVLTALGGATMLAQWLRHGGAKQREGIRPTRVLAHAGLAVLGLILWIAFVVSDERRLAWIAVVLLLVVGLIGATMFAIWMRGRNRREHTLVPAETAFPLPVVLGHGVLALATVTLAILAASGIGT
jgi:manganese efflux pump family protein